MIVIKIENLKCGGCAATIKKGLLSIENVDEVVVDVENDTVSISSKNVLIDLIKEKLSKLGYPEVGDKKHPSTQSKIFCELCRW